MDLRPKAERIIALIETIRQRLHPRVHSHVDSYHWADDMAEAVLMRFQRALKPGIGKTSIKKSDRTIQESIKRCFEDRTWGPYDDMLIALREIPKADYDQMVAEPLDEIEQIFAEVRKYMKERQPTLGL